MEVEAGKRRTGDTTTTADNAAHTDNAHAPRSAVGRAECLCPTHHGDCAGGAE